MDSTNKSTKENGSSSSSSKRAESSSSDAAMRTNGGNQGRQGTIQSSDSPSPSSSAGVRVTERGTGRPTQVLVLLHEEDLTTGRGAELFRAALERIRHIQEQGFRADED